MLNVEPKRARGIRIRMAILCGLLACALVVVIVGAYRIQVADGSSWLELAEKQRQRRLHVRPKRGAILDRTGATLAESVEVPSVSVDAVEMLRGIEERYVPQRLTEYATRIAEALSMPVADVEEKLSRRRRFAWLKRRVSEEEVRRIEALEDRNQRYPIRGLQVEGEGHRFYPNRELGGTFLGFVAPDGEGKEGVELSFEQELAGHTTEIEGLRDRSGRLLFADGVADEQALVGHSIQLTIDKGIQFTAERELAGALKTYEALGGSAVVVDPNTGEILAVASAPGYNPNEYGASDADHRRNRPATDRFEPGSVMKAFTMATAMAAGTITPKSTFFCEEGRMAIDNVIIHDTHPHGTLDITQILSQSSNIGAAKVALEMGSDRLYEGFRRFGFGESTGLPLPGESTGVLRPRARPWVPVETASAAFGQGISVTTMQLVMAMSAIANGGKLMEPIIVKRINDALGTTLLDSSPRVRRQVIPAHVANVLSEMLVSVTEGDGTGVEAAISGYRVAGKTSTAQKIDPLTGAYTKRHYVASFVGFVPADKPRLAIAVVLDEPMAGAYQGGSVAAPVFRRIGEMALRYLGIMPRDSARSRLDDVAKQVKTGDPAEKAYAALAPPEPEPQPSVAPTRPLQSGEVRMPDFQGLPMREAARIAAELGLVPAVRGSGRLMKQEPPPGSILSKGLTVQLVFEPAT